MSGLSKVLVHLDKKNVHLLAVYIFMKIKPFLESVSLVFIYVLYHVINLNKVTFCCILYQYFLKVHSHLRSVRFLKLCSVL